MRAFRFSTPVVIIVLALFSQSCTSEKSQHINKVKELVETALKTGDENAQLPLFVLPNEETARWNDLSRPGRTLGQFETIGDCAAGFGQNYVRLPTITNFRAGLVYPPAPNSTTSQIAYHILYDMNFFEYKTISLPWSAQTMNYVCTFYSDTLKKWMTEHPGLVKNTNSGLAIVAATRENISYDFENSYEVDDPSKGHIPVVSLRFTYDLVPTLARCFADKKGVGSAKAYLDSDTGKWTLSELQLNDPNIEYNPERENR